MAHAVINTVGAGDFTIVPGVPGLRIIVVDLAIAPTSKTLITFKSNATPITGNMEIGGNGSIMSPGYDPEGQFRTGVGENLVMSVSANSNVGGHITYRLAKEL